MSERISLFDELKTGGYETCLATTFNIDFPFYEEVLLRRMRSSGIYHHIVFVDRGMCNQAIEDRPPHMAGQHYSLAPMDCNGAFHPKLLLLLGKNKGFLAVGSHNLTLSGFGQNLEITNAIRFNRANNTEFIALFQTAYDAFLAWTKDYGADLPDDIKESLMKVEKIFPWLRDEISQHSTEFRLLFTSASTPNLWSQLRDFIPTEIRKIIGISAFFDKNLGLVKQLKTLDAGFIYIGVQKDRVQAPAQLVNMEGVTIVESSGLTKSKSAHDYIHAKILSFESDGEQLLVTGSANLSAPAWLAQGEQANAEAIIVRSDRGTLDVIRELGLAELEHAERILKLPEPEDTLDDPVKESLLLLILPYNEGEPIEIPLKPEWTGNLLLGYETTYKSLISLPNSISNRTLLVESRNVIPGEVILLIHNEEPIARIILHNIKQIQQYTSTGLERKVRQALGSLGTESPDIDILFECMDKLTPTNNRDSTKLGLKKGEKATSKPEEEPTTLISAISNRKIDKKSGRHRLPTTADIGIIIDAILNNLKSQIGSELRGINEDSQGRSEEDLIDADDETPELPIPESAATEPDLGAICQNKLKQTIQKLNHYLSIQPTNAVSASLGILILTHRLNTLNNEKHAFITKPLLIELFSVLTEKLLSDKDPFLADAEESGIFGSDEWGRLLGYVTWLAYHADVALKQRLPLSSSSKEKENLRWSNACWLYLAQHISADELARSEASRLIAESGSEPMKFWLEAMTLFRSEKDRVSILGLISGFDLATSPYGAFSGTRLVISDRNETPVALASISRSRVRTGFPSSEKLRITSNLA